MRATRTYSAEMLGVFLLHSLENKIGLIKYVLIRRLHINIVLGKHFLIHIKQTLGFQDISSAKCQQNTAEVALCQQGCQGQIFRDLARFTYMVFLKCQWLILLCSLEKPFRFRTESVWATEKAVNSWRPTD